ncbi:hypothetical protein NDU88_003574 [Pleurodeles waltl]|uniref:Uncharacterized protein n=1 Tax=Pleurodeles waltl TaxID=8319 RepID=A0AAV7RIY2_PLEWA|nr:hypothetical protein NDU88_003574 [Pleurodeles waltl]
MGTNACGCLAMRVNSRRTQVEVDVWLQKKKNVNEFIPFKEVKGNGIQMEDREEEDGVRVEKERKVYRRSSVRVEEPLRLLKDFLVPTVPTVSRRRDSGMWVSWRRKAVGDGGSRNGVIV